MPTVSVHHDRLHVALTRGEKVLGLLRDLDVPLSSVTAVDVVVDGPAATRGLRAPGYRLPGHRAVGTWRGRERMLVAVRARRAALRVALTGQRYDVLLLTVDDPEAAAASLRGAGGPGSQSPSTRRR